MAKRTWRQINGEMIEVTATPSLPEDLRLDSTFVSPVDGSVIRSKVELHDHNRRNNVVQGLPGMEQDIAAVRQRNRDRISGPEGKRQRIEVLRRAFET